MYMYMIEIFINMRKPVLPHGLGHYGEAFDKLSVYLILPDSMLTFLLVLVSSHLKLISGTAFIFFSFHRDIDEPRGEKTCLWGFRPGMTNQTAQATERLARTGYRSRAKCFRFRRAL